MQELKLSFPRAHAHSTIHFGEGILREAASFLAARYPARRIAIIADAAVAALYAPPIASACAERGLACEVFTFPPGEGSKSRAQKERLEDALLARGFGRDSAIVALGGGVTGDLAGFVAATFCRGIPYVQVPTTVLAMADSSVGGKTGVDVPAGKNMVGAFHQPDAVFMDPLVLATLPPREVRAGLVEIVKHACIRDKRLFARIEAQAGALTSPAAHPELFNDILLRSCSIKAEVVRADETESGLRQILNFGHTAGHAIEALSGFTLLHGEAVALGMLAALDASVACAGLARAEAESAAALLARLGAPVRGEFSIPQALDAMRRDKKARRGEILFVLLRALGEAHERPFPVPEATLRRALATIGGRE